MSRSSKSGFIAFKPKARLLKLIGEELISDDVVAVSELVKNAHDADAMTVTISFRGVTGPQGEIEVNDDGCGMNLETLLGRWMQPGASTKVGAGQAITPRGRRMLGEKGVGRFAADKLARHLDLISRCAGSKDEVHAVVDWDRFDDDQRMLEEVQSRWELRLGTRIGKHGTILEMRGLRSVWTERMFRRLSIRLGRLLSPFRERDRFSICIQSDEFPQYSGELRSDILEKAPHRIDLFFDGAQSVTSTTNRTRKVQQRWNGQGELSCGPVRIRLYVFDLDGEAMARVGPRMEVRAWLKEWTGVSIYRDGFRVWPYGEPHDDWLRLDQRRVNNPVEHLSNNQVIGFIDITRDGNPELMDQTNREGLMNNKALDDLRRLVAFVFQIVEAERQTVRHPPRKAQPRLNGHALESLSLTTDLEQLAIQAPAELEKDFKQMREKLDAHLIEERGIQDRFVQGYTGLAVMGQMAANFSQILPEEVKSLKADLGVLRRVLTADNGAKDLLSRLNGAADRIAGQLRMLQLATGDEERRRAIDVVKETYTFRDSVESLLHRSSVRMEIEYSEREVLRTEIRPEQFHCLLQILLTNSLDWMLCTEEKRVRIILGTYDDCCEMIFNDSGPGIPGPLALRVFEPGFSMKADARGMGLTLARQLVQSYRGHISVDQDGRRRGGSIRVLLPRKRSRATIYNER